MYATKPNPDHYPVAVATQVLDASALHPTGLLQKGRSHRVMVPPESASTKQLNDEEVRTLQAQGYTSGLIQSVSRNKLAFPLRIWVVDNSGSMSTGDGHRLIDTGNARDVRYVSCSRWTEIQETVEYHARIAALLGAPTVFRLLNDPGRMAGPQQFSVAERGMEFVADDLNVALATIRNVSPSGVTPLADHVLEIRENVVAMQPELARNGQKVVIVLATDGLPSNAWGVTSPETRVQFQSALRSLQGLPVWVVVRLCTDEEEVVGYYNDLDSQLELNLEVLDDFLGEAEEVYQCNKWLNYALPLHRIREMGFSHKLFDLLDERALTVDELREFLFLLFGPERFDGVPDPQLNWKGFLGHISGILKHEKKQWNPVTKTMAPWVDLKKIDKIYGDKNCVIM